MERAAAAPHPTTRAGEPGSPALPHPTARGARAGPRPAAPRRGERAYARRKTPLARAPDLPRWNRDRPQGRRRAAGGGLRKGASGGGPARDAASAAADAGRPRRGPVGAGRAPRRLPARGGAVDAGRADGRHRAVSSARADVGGARSAVFHRRTALGRRRASRPGAEPAAGRVARVARVRAAPAPGRLRPRRALLVVAAAAAGLLDAAGISVL